MGGTSRRFLQSTENSIKNPNRAKMHIVLTFLEGKERGILARGPKKNASRDFILPRDCEYLMRVDGCGESCGAKVMHTCKNGSTKRI